jgi:phage tail sheath protein FI
MAEIILSPGVLANENDQSQIRSLPVVAGAAIIGPTVKGKPNIPRLVTTFSEFQAEFGTTFLSSSAQEYSFLTSISANNYFQQGGTSLLVTRVANGTFGPATSSNIGSEVFTGGLKTGLNQLLGSLSSFSGSGAGGTFAISASVITGGGAGFTGSITISPGGTVATSISSSAGSGFQAGDTITITSQSLGATTGDGTNLVITLNSNDLASTAPFELETLSEGTILNNTQTTPGSPDLVGPGGTLTNGTADNIRYEITGRNIDQGVFTLVVRRGDDTTNSKAILETLYEKIGTRTQGLVATDYDDAINLLANKDEYQFNVISTPGLNNADHATQVGRLIEVVENRGDAIAVVDLVRYGSTITTVTSEAGERDSSFAAAYWPWLQVAEPTNGQIVWVPASTLIPGVYANTDATAETWFAPAGFSRGGLLGVVQAERKLSQSQRDSLYVGKVNPIATFPGRGVVVFGQKTLQQRQTALDRVNVRRLLISLKSFISQISDNLVFEQNTVATRNNFLTQVNPFLESVQQRQGLFAFKVVMDDTNNTPDVIDRNQLVGQIFLQPTRTAEFILLDFNILPTGATFPS